MVKFFCERCGRRLPPDGGVCVCMRENSTDKEKGSALTVEPSSVAQRNESTGPGQPSFVKNEAQSAGVPRCEETYQSSTDRQDYNSLACKAQIMIDRVKTGAGRLIDLIRKGSG